MTKRKQAFLFDFLAVSHEFEELLKRFHLTTFSSGKFLLVNRELDMEKIHQNI